MKGAAAITTLGLSGLVAANACNNNCGRQVFGTNGSPPQSSRQALCAAYLTSTTTVTPPVATETAPIDWQRRNVHNRAVTTTSAPTITSPKPAYATLCSANIDYWSACQCYGIAPSLVTVTAPTQTTVVPGATCTQGAEFALWVFQQDSVPGYEIEEAYYNVGYLDRDGIVGGVPPTETGITAVLGVNQQTNYGDPLVFDGSFQGPDGSSMQYNVIEHRGYLVPAAPGTYQFSTPYIDDIAAFWVGSHAQTDITIDSAVLSVGLGNYDPPRQYLYTVVPGDVGKPVPFRIFWANAGGPAGFTISIFDPSGTEIFGAGSSKNQQIVSSCSGPGAPDAPEWPAWVDEA